MTKDQLDTLAELLPCPFCGGVGELWKDADPGYPWNVTFKHNDACVLILVPTDFFQSYETEAEAITAWNTRDSLPAIREQLDEVARLRHPTPAMWDAAWTASEDYFVSDAVTQKGFRAGLSAMIEAALNPQENSNG